MTQWQPIKTAPIAQQLLVLRRDGEMHVAKVAGYSDKHGVMCADFGDASCTFFFPVGGNYMAGDAPTHWMPLPALPEQEVDA